MRVHELKMKKMQKAMQMGTEKVEAAKEFREIVESENLNKLKVKIRDGELCSTTQAETLAKKNKDKNYKISQMVLKMQYKTQKKVKQAKEDYKNKLEKAEARRQMLEE